MSGITTIEEAYEFVQEIGVCTIFSGKIKGVPSLWDVVDLPIEGGGNTKWGARVEAVWAWKTELPEIYPDDVFYGKMKGGVAVLMSMEHLREKHYANAYKPIEQCRELAQQVFEIIRLNPTVTKEIRVEAMDCFGCTKSRFETALKELQITLNITRSNEPGLKGDSWLPFRELYYEFEV